MCYNWRGKLLKDSKQDSDKIGFQLRDDRYGYCMGGDGAIEVIQVGDGDGLT